MPTYDFIARACPAPQTSSGVLVPADLTTASAKTLIAGDTSAVLSKLNNNAVRIDMLGRYGGGAYAVATGLELSISSGLTLAISAGLAWADGPSVKGATTLALTGSVWNRVWISRANNISAVLSGSANPLNPPDALEPWVFLGSVLTSSAAIVQIDYSGRLDTKQGTMLFRRTADAGKPSDTPPAGVRFFTKTAGGLYLWDGEEYHFLEDSSGTLAASITSETSEREDLERRFRKLLLWCAETFGEVPNGLEYDLALAACEA